jgi:hypothetical protein
LIAGAGIETIVEAFAAIGVPGSRPAFRHSGSSGACRTSPAERRKPHGCAPPQHPAGKACTSSAEEGAQAP